MSKLEKEVARLTNEVSMLQVCVSEMQKHIRSLKSDRLASNVLIHNNDTEICELKESEKEHGEKLKRIDDIEAQNEALGIYIKGLSTMVTNALNGGLAKDSGKLIEEFEKDRTDVHLSDDERDALIFYTHWLMLKYKIVEKK